MLEEGAIPEQPLPTSDSELGPSGCCLDLPGSARSAGQEWVHCSDDTIRGTTNGPQVHAILHVVFLQLGQDVLAIGVLSKSRNVWPDLGRTVWVLHWPERPEAYPALSQTDTDYTVHTYGASSHKGTFVLLLLLASHEVKTGALALSTDTGQRAHPQQNSTCQPIAQHLPTNT